MPKEFYVYILASRRNGTLYVGVTSDLVRRVWEHKQHAVPGFTDDYDVTSLVYVEKHSEIREALRREKRLKKWNRQWKLALIEQSNPDWEDLFDRIRP